MGKPKYKLLKGKLLLISFFVILFTSLFLSPSPILSSPFSSTTEGNQTVLDIVKGNILDFLKQLLPQKETEVEQQILESKKEEYPPPLVTSSDKPSFVANEILIKITSKAKDPKSIEHIKKAPTPFDTGLSSLNELNKKYQASSFEQVAKEGKNSKTEADVFRWYRVTFPLSDKTEKVISEDSQKAQELKKILFDYQQDANIEEAEFNYVITLARIPNDPYYHSSGSWGQPYDDMWGLKRINPEPAWDQTIGDPNIVVAVIDTGVDRNHEDLAANMWVNETDPIGDIPDSCDHDIYHPADDDCNGYVDDYYGWDWGDNDNDPLDNNDKGTNEWFGHGTMCAGILGAVGNNNIGLNGVNWRTRIMALKIWGARNLGDGAAAALTYAADMRAGVSSNSWIDYPSKVIQDAVRYEYEMGMVIVAAVGNDSENLSRRRWYPAFLNEVIAVSASNPSDNHASWSNYGEKIEVAAPGIDTLSTAVPGSIYVDGDLNVKYFLGGGTSGATPYVAGLAALILSQNPFLTNEEVRQIIRSGADDLGVSGKDIYFGYGRINAGRSLALTPPTAACNLSFDSSTVTKGQRVTITVNGSSYQPAIDKLHVYYRKNSTDPWKAIGAPSTATTAQYCGREVPLDQCSISCSEKTCSGSLSWNTNNLEYGDYQVVCNLYTVSQADGKVYGCSGNPDPAYPVSSGNITFTNRCGDDSVRQFAVSAPPPQNLSMSCPTEGNYPPVVFSWDNVEDVPAYIVRINKAPADDWHGSGDQWLCVPAQTGATTSKEVQLEFDSQYTNWSVQSSNADCSARWGQSEDQPAFSCPSPPVTWTINAQAVCINGVVPQAETQLGFALWPPNPFTFQFDEFSSGVHSQQITSTHSWNGVYVILGTRDYQLLLPTGTPPHPAITAHVRRLGHYNEWFFKRRELPAGTYNLTFLAPDLWCPTPTPILGCNFANADVNQNGKVDLMDLVIVGGCFGLPPQQDCQRADIDRDGDIDQQDLECLGSYYGITPTATPVSSVDVTTLKAADLNQDGLISLLDYLLAKESYGERISTATQETPINAQTLSIIIKDYGKRVK